jgi:HlyD family secretion protein
MSASADIQTKRHENALSVPINAVTTREKGSDKAVEKQQTSQKQQQSSNLDESEEQKTTSLDLEEVVFVLQPDNKVKKVKVRTDIQDINYIQILSGLKEGDQIVTGPYSLVSKSLADGAKVKVVEKDKLFETAKN